MEVWTKSEVLSGFRGSKFREISRAKSEPKLVISGGDGAAEGG